MICEKCKKEFTVDAAVERLMKLSVVPILCDICAKTAPRSAEAPHPAAAVTPSSVLRRIEVFDTKGLSIRFMALPPERNYFYTSNTLRKPKKTDMHVFVISSSGQEITTTPQIRIKCNVDTFEKQRSKFWAIKTPDAWDAFTGVSRIEVPFQEIDRVEREFNKVKLFLKNGESVCLLYS